MFGLSWGQIIIIVLVGVFLLGPERIPVAVQWVTKTMAKARNMAQGAQAQLRSEIGPELDELRKQIADLQSLKELQELRNLRDLHPRALLGKTLLGDQPGGLGGGLTSFLGLDQPAAAVAPSVDTPAVDTVKPVSATMPDATMAPATMPDATAVRAPAVSTVKTVPPLTAGERPPIDPDAT